MAAAIAAREQAADVLLVERGTLGGSCLNVGCVPSKTLLGPAGSRAAASANPFAGDPLPHRQADQLLRITGRGRACGHG